MLGLFARKNIEPPLDPMPLVGLNKRRLGRTELMVSEIGFGAWPLGGSSWGGRDDTSGLAALTRAFDAGVNFVDTALIYGSGHSERLIQKALRCRSERVFVATKIPPRNRQWPARAGVSLRDAFPFEYVKQCTENSLRNLQRDALDLQQFHVWNSEWAADPEWHKTVEWLKTTGKARFIGISANDHEPASVETALRTGLVDCVQLIYNIFDQSAASELFPLCQELDVGVIARVPFDEGSLTGTITPQTKFAWNDFRRQYFAGERKLEVWQRIQALKEELGSGEPLATTALRFCLSHPAVSTIIPGSRNARHVEQNLAASRAGALSEETLQRLARHRWCRNFYS
jgi:aryl-alcohol dehydrogenase-like predicted oxidoreductase